MGNDDDFEIALESVPLCVGEYATGTKEDGTRITIQVDYVAWWLIPVLNILDMLPASAVGPLVRVAISHGLSAVVC